MQLVSKSSLKTWLRTERPVILTNTALWPHLPAVENALHDGLFAVSDVNRPEFYEIEVGDNWYYIHIPSRIGGVYLIAAGKSSLELMSAVAAR